MTPEPKTTVDLIRDLLEFTIDTQWTEGRDSRWGSFWECTECGANDDYGSKERKHDENCRKVKAIEMAEAFLRVEESLRPRNADEG